MNIPIESVPSCPELTRGRGAALRFWSRFPLFVATVILLLLACVECRAQSGNGESNSGPILPANTPVILQLKKNLLKREAKPGQTVEFEVGYDVVVNGQVMIRSGAAVNGSVRKIDHTGEAPGKVLLDLEPLHTVSQEIVRLRWTPIEKASEPGTADVVGMGAEAGPILPALVIASLFEKKVVLREGAYGVARSTENVALDPVKQQAAQEQYATNKKAAQAELCRLLASPDSLNADSWMERINLLERRSGLDEPDKAEILRAAGDLDAAIEVYQQLLASKQDLPCSVVAAYLPSSTIFSPAHLHLRLAELFREKPDFVHAIAEYRTVVQLDPKDERSRIGLINALEDSGDLDSAMAEVKEAMRVSPDNPYFHYLLGRLLVEKKDADAAIVELQEALQKTKNHLSPANCALGRAYELKGDLKAALGQYRTAYRAQVQDESCRAAYKRLKLQLDR